MPKGSLAPGRQQRRDWTLAGGPPNVRRTLHRDATMGSATDWKPRDLEILRLLGEGLSDRAIAERLRLRPETIRWYNKRIFERLGVSSRIQAVRKAIAEGVLPTLVAPAPVPPVTRSPIKYLKRDGPSIAYQVVGDGPVDLVFVQSFISNLEVEWDEPECAAFFERLARGARLFLFDRRGVGLSDRTDHPTAMHETVEDIRAMLAAEGSTRTFVLGSSEGGAASVLFASMHPDLVQGLILFGATAKATRDGDEPHWARDLTVFRERVERIVETWGGPWAIAEYAPSRADEPRFREWWARMLRASSSPTGIRRVLDAVTETDVRALLPHVGVRTLVLHRAGDRLVPTAAGRYLAEQMPNATYLELPGADHMLFIDSDRVVDAVHGFLREPTHAAPETWIGVLLCGMGSGSGLDPAKRALLEGAAPRRVFDLADGWVAVFDTPERAVRAAERLRALGRGRAGAFALHAGACDRATDAPGAAALDAVRSLARGAAPLEIRLSGMLRDLMSDPGRRFEPVPEGESLHWRLRD